ncbi:hypothetical protein AAG570_012847 [Ranatra chinensis]|uniref:Ig-like domain-containing protein n=1 Tax=Ranatra chinensis TaxID=642074 RepID=A0ABD0YF28_9HEMI
MASKRRNLFHKNKKQETTEIGPCNLPPFCDFKPIEVKLIGDKRGLKAGTPHQIKCRVAGSTPPPVITWHKRGHVIQGPTQISISSDGNITTSTLTFTPEIDDLGAKLTCIASNPHLPTALLNDSWILDVLCKDDDIAIVTDYDADHLLDIEALALFRTRAEIELPTVIRIFGAGEKFYSSPGIESGPTAFQAVALSTELEQHSEIKLAVRHP